MTKLPETIVWDDHGLKKFAHVARNCDLAVDEIAKLTVPAGLDWHQATLAEAEVECHAWVSSQLAVSVRGERDLTLLNEVDPVVSNPLRWADLTAEHQAAWADYRRDLLDITAQPGFPHDVTWPTKPE